MSYKALFVYSMLVACMSLSMSARAQEKGTKQVLELRTYTLVNAAAEDKLDSYLSHALLPALERQGLGPIGVFDQPANAETEEIQIMVLIPGPSVEAVTRAAEKLSTDAQYQTAAREYLETPAGEPLIKRINSELLMSFDCWPQATVPQQKTAGKDRLFELRIYESPSEHLGNLKVEMFNAGEVPIFLDCQIAPVFMGQALIGSLTPNLTYMTVYNNDAERQAAWKAFAQHPDWQKLKAVAKYQGTVSKIHKSDWVPKPYSHL